ncbi:hypothetical protein PORY_002070, partial [Pneumocystis oryctolagi]
MRIPVFSFFIGLTYAFLKDTKFTDENPNAILNDIGYSENDIEYLYNSNEQSLHTGTRDSSLLEHIKKFETILQKKENKDQSYLLSLSLENGDTGLSKDDVYLLGLLSSYLGDKFVYSECEKTLKQACLLARDYSGLESKTKNVLLGSCENVDVACARVLQMLYPYCRKIGNMKINVDEITHELCGDYLVKCDSLLTSCGNALAESCRKVQDKCKRLTAREIHEDYITNTHTQIIDSTTYITETVYHTHTEVLFSTRKCCSGKVQYRICSTSKKTVCPTPTIEPEPEPEPTSSEPQPTETSSEEPQPTETSSEEPQPTEEPLSVIPDHPDYHLKIMIHVFFFINYRIISDYYDSGTWFGECISSQVYSLISDMGKEDNELLWLAII